MTEAEARNLQDRLAGQLAQVSELLRLDHREELRNRLVELHPADIADLLEGLPLDERLAVWKLVRPDQDGEILLEVSDAVRESLIADMDEGEILAAIEPMEADDLADLVEDLPPDLLPDLMASLDHQQRERVQSALSYPEEQVGAL